MNEMEKAMHDLQSDYETRRRARMLGLSIDQTLTGIKNIIVYGDERYWPNDKIKFAVIRSQAEDLLVEVMKLERKLSGTISIYATFVPQNVEVHQLPKEMES